MLVKEMMNTEVLTISPDSTICKAAEKMTEHRVGSLIVVSDHKLIGILTEHDILTKSVAQAKDASKTLVKDVMTKEVTMVSPDTDIRDASKIMVEKRIKKLPVMDQHRIVGIVTSMDICTAEPKLIEEVSKLFLLPRKKKFLAG